MLNLGLGGSIMGDSNSGYVVGISYTITAEFSALPISVDANIGSTKIY